MTPCIEWQHRGALRQNACMPLETSRTSANILICSLLVKGYAVGHQVFDEFVPSGARHENFVSALCVFSCNSL